VVEITTRKAASPSSWEQAPQVSFTFEKRELKEALHEIADATGVNIVLDARAVEKGKTLVNATVRDVGVDTAVQLLANMADLTIMPVENVLYVTTRANAKALRAELLHLEPEKIEDRNLQGVAEDPSRDQTEKRLKEYEEEIRRLKEQLKQKQQSEPMPKSEQ
jgi:hypothetical protein